MRWQKAIRDSGLLYWNKPSRTFKEMQEEKPKKNGLRMVREKDLRHHLENDKKPKKEEKKSPEPKANGETGDKEDSKMQEMIRKDNQLNTALLILKGLNVLKVAE